MSAPPADWRWAAPGRVNLIGEHTDYNDGFVLPLAIDRRTRVAAEPRSDESVTVRSRQSGDEVRFDLDTRPGEVEGWAAYVAGVVWAMREQGHQVTGVDLEIDGDVPLGAGLSSSASLECAVAVALADLAGLDLDRTTLARLAQRAENDYVGMPSGVMDQMASMHGRAGHLMLIDTRSISVEQVPLDLDAAGLCLLVLDTAAAHQLLDGGYASRRRECEAAAAALGVHALRDASLDDLERIHDPLLQRRARHVVTENARVLQVVRQLREAGPRGIGAALNASHASLRDDFDVSTDELDVVVDTALEAGALGARLTGGGFGGSAIALSDRETVDEITSRVVEAFSRRGFGRPSSYTVHPAQGACRL
jgi:galactokinase